MAMKFHCKGESLRAKNLKQQQAAAVRRGDSIVLPDPKPKRWGAR